MTASRFFSRFIRTRPPTNTTKFLAPNLPPITNTGARFFGQVAYQTNFQELTTRERWRLLLDKDLAVNPSKQLTRAHLYNILEQAKRYGVEAICLDNSGTITHPFSYLPILAFYEACKEICGLEIPTEHIAKDMGLDKMQHAKQILIDFAETFKRQHGRTHSDKDAAAIHECFISKMLAYLPEHTFPLPFIRETLQACAEVGMRVVTTTGFPQVIAAPLTELLQGDGLPIEFCIASDEFNQQGVRIQPRPATDALCLAAQLLGISPANMVVVDDTPPGLVKTQEIAWTCGVYPFAAGTEIRGMHHYQKLLQSDPGQLLARREQAKTKLAQCGTHYVTDQNSLPHIIATIGAMIKSGFQPSQYIGLAEVNLDPQFGFSMRARNS